MAHAEEKARLTNYNRILGGVRTGRNPVEVKGNAERLVAEERSLTELKYVGKTRKIGSCKMIKEKMLAQISERNKKELAEHQRRHVAEYKKRADENLNRMMMYRRELEDKQRRCRNFIAMQSTSKEEREYVEKLRRLSDELREENKTRMQRAMANRRKKILSNYESLAERNNEAKDSFNLYQCHIRYGCETETES